MSDLQIAITTLKETNFGDHGERLTEAYPTVPGETVEDLVRRVFPNLDSPYYQTHYSDVVEIRVMVGCDGKPAKAGPDPWAGAAPIT